MKKYNRLLKIVFTLLSTLIVITVPVISPLAYANEFSQQETTMLTLANELEYILTDLYTLNQSGQYVPNYAAINASHYSDKEKNDIHQFVSYLSEVGTTKSSAVGTEKDGFISETRPLFDAIGCIQTTFGIGRTVALEIYNHAKQGRYLAAISALFVAQKLGAAAAAHPNITVVALISYLSICGADTVY